MLFSIVVPVYKVEDCLDKCVQSLINQTYKDIEIILVDDGSPDNCPDLCDNYAISDTRIKAIHKSNGGLSDARNAGILAATGEYIIFLDSDDYFEIDTCEKFSKLAKDNIDIITGGAIVEGASINLSHIEASDAVYSGPEYFKTAMKHRKAPMAAWLNVYRRQFLIDNNLQFKYGILHEDEDFTPRALLAAEKILVSDICFYHYIIREGSITTKKDKRKNANDLFDTISELEVIYRGIDDIEFRNLLLDSLSAKYLSFFQSGKLYQYGKNYLHKEFVLRNAVFKKTKAKAYLYNLSPRLYYLINSLTK